MDEPRRFCDGSGTCFSQMHNLHQYVGVISWCCDQIGGVEHALYVDQGYKLCARFSYAPTTAQW